MGIPNPQPFRSLLPPSDVASTGDAGKHAVNVIGLADGGAGKACRMRVSVSDCCPVDLASCLGCQDDRERGDEKDDGDDDHQIVGR